MWIFRWREPPRPVFGSNQSGLMFLWFRDGTVNCFLWCRIPHAWTYHAPYQYTESLSDKNHEQYDLGWHLLSVLLETCYTTPLAQTASRRSLMPYDAGHGWSPVSTNVKHFFTLLGKMFFTSYGKEFFIYHGKQIFTSQGKHLFTRYGKQTLSSAQPCG